MTLNKFGIPENDKGLIRPLTACRFKIKDCRYDVTDQVMNIEFDFVNNLVKVQLRANIDPKSFEHAMRFNNVRFFTVQMIEGGSIPPHFGIHVSVVKAVEHSLRFDYAMDGVAFHNVVFKAQFSILEYLSEEEKEIIAALPSDPNFPTPAEAIEKLKSQNNDATKVE